MRHTVGTTTTNYVWDVAAGLPVVLQDGDNTYVYGLDLISATDSLDDQVYFLYDGLGSVTDETDEAGDVVASYSYDVFGAIRSESGSSENYWQFTGEQIDADSGLQYLRARHYDPETGRFLGRDPLGIGNRYSYVSNNPTNLVDPYGLFGCDIWVTNPCDWPGDAWNWIGDRANDVNAAIDHLIQNPWGLILGNEFNQALAVLISGFSDCGDRREKEGGIVVYENCGGLAGLISCDLFGGDTFTLGSFIFDCGNIQPDVLKHELAHVQEYDVLGKNFLGLYFANALGAYVGCVAAGADDPTECAGEWNALEQIADFMAGTDRY